MASSGNATPYPGNLTLNVAMEILGMRAPFPASSSDLNPSDEPVTRSNISQEQRAIEKKIVGMINRGEWDLLQPNSGNAIEIGAHQLCVGFQEDAGSGYRSWHWHGHIVVYEEEGYFPEYFHGHHFQPLISEDVKSAQGVGLGELLRSFEATGIRRSA
ncbi:hypothetical protein O6H91_04G055300 [Diphasiastrum complanatum]|uniref:Uncharacterized protein n=1 Tax=Diphasiastrum complanatum TaxID=34168 RepID=A0ACC2DX91_DIPCM|nr:hypothetical protein O6H91_Y484200 [Diphasiastrum complanatum]KAJ7558775.1 hypothetical protein O6H91_04G055300 [Diphasiastrum complanatum]